MRLIRSLFLWVALALSVAGVAVVAPLPVVAQQADAIDYQAWERDASTAEDLIANGRASTQAMEDLRARIATWRTAFDGARNVNGAQIDTLKSQIAALGAAPADGSAETPEIAQRRRDLAEQLSRQQAPGLAAVEAFSRADGIIRQIDKLIRDRQASALLMLLPSPANPLHWPSGAAVLTQGVRTLWDEISASWDNPARRSMLRNNLPLIVICLALAGLLMARGPGFMERLSVRLQNRAAMRARNAVAALVSLGQVVLPVVGMILLVVAVLSSGLTGPRSEALVRALPDAAFDFFVARWLASWLFAEGSRVSGRELTDRPAEARFHLTMIGLMMALEAFRNAFTTEVRPPLSQAAQAVWLAPVVCIVAIFLFRLGLLLYRQTAPGDAAPQAEDQLFRHRMIGLAGLLLVGVSLIAPLLALIGYVAAANALIWPTIGSAALIGFIILVQRFLTDIYLIFAKADDGGREALVPVLIGLLLGAGALPLFALIWGARSADLSEIWTQFQGGIVFGGARISPTAILTLMVIFALGYMLTRLLQGAMRTSVLPRTRLDKGAQNAAVAGLGYVGIFLSALVAVTAAGIDLSSLAIIAGALSVGIGFGLQNIVQNFISGIILLVERPISEGDMIQVGSQTGIVKGISVRSTWIETFDHADVIVPNADLVSGVVTNLTRGDLTCRLIVPVSVAYGSDTHRVQAILQDIAEAQPLVLVNPPPSVYFVALGPDALNFEIRAILSDVNFKLVVQGAILHEVVAKFAAEGIEIPFRQQDIWLRNPEALQKDAPPRTTRAVPSLPASDAGAAVSPKVQTPAAVNNVPDEEDDPR